MPKTKITREALRNHMHYGKWVYVVIAIGCFFASDLLFTMTEYRPPKERKVELQIVGSYMQIEGLDPFCEQALKVGQAFDPTLEQVAAYNIAYSGDAEADIYGAQKFMVMVAAQEGDIYLLPRNLFDQLYEGQGLMKLDDFVERGLLNVDGLDLSACTLPEPVEQESSDPYAEPEPVPVDPNAPKYLYGLPASALTRMNAADIQYDSSDAVLVVMAYCVNPDTTMAVLQSFIDQLSVPAPEVPAETPAETPAEVPAQTEAPAAEEVPAA